jgi:hypothetical protein
MVAALYASSLQRGLESRLGIWRVTKRLQENENLQSMSRLVGSS